MHNTTGLPSLANRPLLMAPDVYSLSVQGAPPNKQPQHQGAAQWRDEFDPGNGVFEGFTPLTSQEAQKIKIASAALSPWEVVRWQALVGVLLAGIAWMLTGEQIAGWSSFYGALAVVVPAALFARGMSRQAQGAPAGTLLAGFAVWELLKVGLAVAMLCAAPRLIAELNWLALLAGFVVTTKVYWVAMWLCLARRIR